MDLINDVPFTNPVINDSSINSSSNGYIVTTDPLDLEGGQNHMSNRGNLIFSLKVLEIVKDKIGV